MSQNEQIWYVKLPANWKAIFEKIAKEKGDTTHGGAARQFRQTVRPTVIAAEAE